MILQALVEHYETLAEAGKVSRKGWCHAKVSYALNISLEGELKAVVPLLKSEERGKKTVWLPTLMEVPQMVARYSGVSANFLCDNSKYFLGIDREGCSPRTRDCFEAAKEKHLKILQETSCPVANAVKLFFEKWKPELASDHVALQDLLDEITEGGNLIFEVGLEYPQSNDEVRKAWEGASSSDVPEQCGICLVTGRKEEISRIHGTIKGVPGAQSSGAALVSFNAASFESYGKEQSFNAPVGKYAAFAYTTALNYLLTQKQYVFQLGDTTVVFWAEDGEEAYQDIFNLSIEPIQDNQETLKGFFKNLAENRPIDVGDIILNPEQTFYILGLAPNAARLSVRFFYQDSFGHILTNIKKHYDRMRMVKPSWETREYLGIGRMVFETVNQKSKDKTPIPNMAAMTLKSMISDSRYPESLYSNLMIRIRAEQGRITWGRAAIIKAFLIKNRSIEKGETLMGLDEEREDKAYILGRLFSVMEAIQEAANPGINSTIHDRYFNSASATPAAVFPILIRLMNSHMKKIARDKAGAKINLEKQVIKLMGQIEAFPKRLTLDEQGMFDLGYYHQTEKRYTKKEEK